jgi:hypothetical protein
MEIFSQRGKKLIFLPATIIKKIKYKVKKKNINWNLKNEMRGKKEKRKLSFIVALFLHLSHTLFWVFCILIE